MMDRVGGPQSLLTNCLLICLSILGTCQPCRSAGNPDLSREFDQAVASIRQAREAKRPSRTQGSPSCARPWIFFDLGENTLLSTPKDAQTGELHDIAYMPGALDYLRQLKSQGYVLGLLINWPPGSGGLKGLKQYIAPRWVDSTPLDDKTFWSMFSGEIFLSRTAAERKPNPPLFEEAVSRAGAAGCKAVYQGTLPDEIDAADRAGMDGYEAGEPGRPYYLPETSIQNIRMKSALILSR